MQFKVPQFIEIESKIIGSLTFKQAIYVGGAAGISYVLFDILPTLFAIPLILIVALFGWALAFLPKRKYGKPFISIVESAIKYATGGKLYTWKRKDIKSKNKPRKSIHGIEKKKSLLFIPKVSGGGLSAASKRLEAGER